MSAKVTPTAESKPKGLKNISPPEVFDGSDFRSFRKALRIYVGANAVIYDTDEKKIWFALSYMKKGTAEDWSENFLEDAEYDGQKFGTWNKFLQKLAASFDDVNERSHALDQLNNLKQGSKSLEGFFQEFEILRRKAGKVDTANDPDMIRLLEMAVHREIVNQILSMETERRTFDAWKKAAQKFDRVEQRRKEINRLRANPKPKQWSKQTTTTTTTTAEAGPVQTKKTASGVTFGGQGEPMNIDQMRKEGRCFKCREKGHLSRDCPTKVGNGRKETFRALIQGAEREEIIRMLKEEGFGGSD
jgi:hypothetical protein